VVSDVEAVVETVLCLTLAPARVAMSKKRLINMSGMVETLAVRREISLALSQAAVS